MLIEPAPESYRFTIEAFNENEFKELFDMISWIRENCALNGRVHIRLDGGVHSSGQWLRGEIVFTNDTNGRDANEFATHFKLRWCGANS